MVLNEIGSPAGFEFKKIIQESERMKSDDYPDSIFFFNKVYCGECNLRIDTQKEVIFVSVLILDYLQGRFNIDPKDLVESIEEIIWEEFRDYQFVAMADWEIDHYDTEYKNDKFTEITI